MLTNRRRLRPHPTASRLTRERTPTIPSWQPSPTAEPGASARNRSRVDGLLLRTDASELCRSVRRHFAADCHFDDCGFFPLAHDRFLQIVASLLKSRRREPTPAGSLLQTEPAVCPELTGEGRSGLFMRGKARGRAARSGGPCADLGDEFLPEGPPEILKSLRREHEGAGAADDVLAIPARERLSLAPFQDRQPVDGQADRDQFIAKTPGRLVFVEGWSTRT